YGGLQDNSSWVGDSSYPGGVSNSRWENIGGGDGFWAFEDTGDPDYIYSESQGGAITRANRHTLESRPITPYPGYGEKKLRLNWNTPIHMSPNEKGTVYLGAQFLFRSRDHGHSWERISPDLTTNDPEKQKQEESGGITVDNSSAEMHTTIYSISESPKNGQVIWVGTDDGNVQITRDGGRNWTNVVKNIGGLAPNSWVSTIEAGRFAEGTAYATFDRHTFGDMKPYCYRTTDFGQTWAALPVAESGVTGYAHVIKEDVKDPQLLFLGTEFGLWVSLDGGQRWVQYKPGNFPAVAVRDIAVHSRDNDLVLATHGRGIWIIDDIAPLRALTPELMAKEAGFVQGRDAIQYIQAGGGYGEGDGTFFGPERPQQAFITYYQRSRHIFGDLKLEIFDAQGKLVDSPLSSKHRGLNRATWSMRMKAPRTPPAATGLFVAGPRVLPGIYTVKLTKGDQVYTSQLNVVLERRSTYTLDDRKAQFDLANRLAALLNHMTWAVENIIAVRDAATARADALPAGKANDALRSRLASLAGSADQIRTRIVATKEGGMITGEERLREYLGGLYSDVNSYDGRPTASQVERTEALGHELEDVIQEFTRLTAQQLPAINRELGTRKAAPIQITNEREWQVRQQ
ncbi:MAG: sialidase, partial [Acidobacteria bacterium]|nr:sialidase [Acidobacteriota bacterium]